MIDLVKRWKEAAKRDDVLDEMVPSDIRQLVGKIERLQNALAYFTALEDPNTWKYGREKAAGLAFQAMTSGSLNDRSDPEPK